MIKGLRDTPHRYHCNISSFMLASYSCTNTPRKAGKNQTSEYVQKETLAAWVPGEHVSQTGTTEAQRVVQTHKSRGSYSVKDCHGRELHVMRKCLLLYEQMWQTGTC